jgi:GT2 family glycosyltransferase
MKYRFIVVHHSATPPTTSVESIRQAHLDRGFDDIGYHYVILPTGEVVTGRPESVEGAHAYGLNKESLGVCCVGNFEEESPPPDQIAALVEVVSELCKRFDITAENIIGHRDAQSISESARPTKCPGDLLYAKLSTIRGYVEIANEEGVIRQSVSFQTAVGGIVTITGSLSWRLIEKVRVGSFEGATLFLTVALRHAALNGEIAWESSVQLLRDSENPDQLLFSAYLPEDCLSDGNYFCEGHISGQQGMAGSADSLPLFRVGIQIPVLVPFTDAVPPLRAYVEVEKIQDSGPFLVRLSGLVMNSGSVKWTNIDETSPYRIGAMVVSGQEKSAPELELRYDIVRPSVKRGEIVPFTLTFDTTELLPGEYFVHVDVVKERRFWFSEIGGHGDSVRFSVSEKRPKSGTDSQHSLNPPMSGSISAVRSSFLYIAPTVPLFDRSTGGRRLLDLFTMLREEGVAVTFLYQQIGTFTNPQKYLSALDAIGVVHAIDPLGYLAEQGASMKFNLCVLGWYSLAFSYLPAIRALLPTTRIAVDSVDVHWAREALALATKVSTLTEEDVELEKEREVAAYRGADEVWVVSDAEADLIHEELLSTKTRVIGIPCEKSHRYIEQPTGKGILFVGGFAHPPNKSAAIWAADIVTEFNKDRERPVSLTIVGADPPEEVLELRVRPGISVVGFVDSLDEIHEEAKVFLCPLRAGGGVKGKICDAIGRGVPVITNRIGNEGLNLIHGEEILLAETTAEFIELLRRVFDDEVPLDDLRRNALDALLKLYGRASVKAQLFSSFTLPHVVIAIVTYNKRDLLRACVYSILEKTTYPHYTIAVVSNACSDGTMEFLKELSEKYPGKIQVFPSEVNHFFVRPNHYIINQFEDADIVLVNNDVEVVNGGWLANLVDAAYSASNVCGAGGLVLDSDGKISEAGAEIYSSGSGTNLYRGAQPGNVGAQAIRSVGFVSGCLMYMRRDAIRQIGPLDDDFHPMYFEDAAWHYKAHVEGLKTMYTPWSIVVHKEGSTAGTDTSKGMKRYQTINRDKFLEKFKEVDFERFNGSRGSS